MKPLNHILKKCIGGYKLNKLQEQINHLMYMDGIKLIRKNERELETLIQAVRIYSQEIGMYFDMEKTRHMFINVWPKWLKKYYLYKSLGSK